MNYILFDIEATCWNGYHSNGIQEIIELAAISIDRFGEETDTFLHFVQPRINPRLSQYCRKLTGITQKAVDLALPFEGIYHEFEDWAGADVDTWFVSWGSFDTEILNDQCLRIFNEKSLILNHLDLQSAYTRLKGLPPLTSLTKAVEYEEWEFEGEPHRAMPDTRNMSSIFREYFGYWGFS